MENLSLALGSFQGPLDLLLHLIEKDKIDIYDIPIVSVTEQYISYLHNLSEFDMDVASDFLVMAATLLQIKSRMLLPKQEQAEDEEEEDPRQKLVQMLVEYKKIKEQVLKLLDMKTAAARYAYREPMFKDLTNIQLPNYHVSLLWQAMAGLTQVKSAPKAYIEPQAFSVEKKMEAILARLQKQPQGFCLSELFSSGQSGEKVAAFLGILELLKLKLVRISQSERFAPIYVFQAKGDRK